MTQEKTRRVIPVSTIDGYNPTGRDTSRENISVKLKLVESATSDADKM